jgi:hypothetical protein
MVTALEVVTILSLSPRCLSTNGAQTSDNCIVFPRWATVNPIAGRGATRSPGVGAPGRGRFTRR